MRDNYSMLEFYELERKAREQRVFLRCLCILAIIGGVAVAKWA